MEPIWKPLEERLGRKRCAGFMYLGRVNGINLYKHRIARSYLNLDDLGRCYLCRGYGAYERAEFAMELAKLETAPTQLGETLESSYDDSCIAPKKRSFEQGGHSTHVHRNRAGRIVHQLSVCWSLPSAIQPLAALGHSGVMA